MGIILSWALGCVAVEGNLHATAPPPSVPAGPEEVPAEPVVVTPPTPAVPPVDTPSEDEEAYTGSPGDRLFAEGTIQDLAITLSEDAWRSLRDHPDEEVEGVITWRGTDYAAGVKIKGSSSFRPLQQKASFKVDVHQYTPEQRLDGLKRLTLNNMIQDPTMLREHAYYWLAGPLGVPAPRHAYARLTVNGEPYGLYGIVETMDGRLMKRLYPDDKDGNLYEASGADFTSARNWFDLQVDGGLVPTPDDIDGLVDALEEADDDELMGLLDTRFDPDALLGYLALDTVTGNDDGYVFNHHNYHAYHLAHADKWVLLPWGTDRSFTEEVSPYGSWDKPIIGVLALRCWDDDACAERLRGRIGDVLGVWEDGGFLEHLAATAELIREDCEADPRREKDCDPEDITSFVADRAGFVRDELE